MKNRSSLFFAFLSLVFALSLGFSVTARGQNVVNEIGYWLSLRDARNYRDLDAMRADMFNAVGDRTAEAYFRGRASVWQEMVSDAEAMNP